ncbi:hypothetical protein G7Y89_g9830 [Cudoniella acicularis]|uniref:Sacsin/Nov domain-containing protein n=1 Tax=Cudoniella acicularis TaxID=354080 RepID=A0A8H4W1I2_9HELO|nr:hypothetical protein G7Y89_g9830 [Cudoniella acicularis]
MATISREAARLLVGKIREENGGISPEDRAASPPGVLRALENVRRKLGAAAKTLATNLYSKDTRFVYELIQNAEDNKYTQAKADNMNPYLGFELYPDKIVVESNEDGFREEDVRAICSTGESTKVAAQGYIGEKGIGFKSVFKVAKKVHIQSGPFSFSFEYTKDGNDDGLGMVTPLNEDFEDLPSDIRTRMTLTLLDPSIFEQQAQDLLKVPDALLLFLTDLKQLEIKIYSPNRSPVETNYARCVYEQGGNLETVQKITTVDGESTEKTQDFFVVKKEIPNLPIDEARRDIHQATVILAFPVDEEEDPIISPQHVFAFLPLRLAGFTFLIQSDFITQASREDVFHSPRNKRLLSGVAETFQAAVLRFCEHPSLRYQWMRYLPDDSISDEFWKTLRPKIISLLTNTRCLWSWSESSLQLPSKLYRITPNFKDRWGQPLFEDSVPEEYLSQDYSNEDFRLLKILSVRIISFARMITKIRADLEKTNSKMRATDTDKDWHMRTAKLLSSPFKMPFLEKFIKDVESLELIPLQDGRWVSTEASPNYFPESRSIPIPTDLGLNLVQPAAVANPDRKALLWNLGVTEAPAKKITDLIIKRYDEVSNCTMEENISHLRYLYWNRPHDSSAVDEDIFLMNQNEVPVFRIGASKEHLYFGEEEEEYGPWQLLRSVSVESPSTPVLHVNFLHKAYLEAVPLEALQYGNSWKTWLSNYAGVHSSPQLTDPTLSKISTEFKYIMEHRSEKLAGLLKRFWSFYEHRMAPFVVKKLKRCLVPTTRSDMWMLQSTFVPLPKLIEITERLKIVNFPFLNTPQPLTNEDENEWQFLKRFGVQCTNDLRFYLTALESISEENKDEWRSSSLDAFLDFEENDWIYIPSSATRAPGWVYSGECVWTAPEWLEAKRRLNGVSKFADHEYLFRIILKIGNANWKDYLEDLKSLKEQGLGNNEKILDIYRFLWREFECDSAWDSIRSEYPASKSWVLGVQKPNLEMHVQALKELARSQPPPSTSEIKRMIMLISSMDPDADDVTELRRSNIFSVKLTNGQKKFTDSSSDFAIGDRAEYGSAFAGKIRILDYSIEEVRACRSLLLALDLKSRHLSELVEEKTTVEDGEIDNELSQSFRLKAYALFRCTVHYHSQKSRDGDRSLYTKLLDASVYLSDGISKSISVSQYGETVTVENSRGKFHLDESNGELRLYIPRDKVAREECLFRQLPRRLMKYFAISDASAEALLNGVIGCTSLVAVDGILKDAGIVEVDGIERPSQSDEYFDYQEARVEDVVTLVTESQASQSRSFTPISPTRTIHTSHNEASYYADVQHEMPHRNRRTDDEISISGGTPLLRPQESVDTVPPILNVGSSILDQDYASLLERMINSAARMIIPVKGAYILATLQNRDLLGATVFGSVFGPRSLERDRKVGAAGELLIFEILTSLGLPGFSRDNWKSTIRREVCVHNKYRDLEPWVGRETADLTYYDHEGDLTKLFIEKGYLSGETWQDERPTYYLEVKTSTRDCSEAFYMSGSQYERMRGMQLQPQRPAPNIYVLLRVFNLEGRVGLRVFVDPESSRIGGELVFNVDTWAVTTSGNGFN